MNTGIFTGFVQIQEIPSALDDFLNCLNTITDGGEATDTADDNTADNNTYSGLLFQDNNIGAFIAFRNYAGSGTNDGTNGDALYYGTYTDHIFQAGSAETVGGRTEVFRIKGTGKTIFYTGIWHNSSDGYERFHFGGSANTYFKSPNSTFTFRNSSDADIMTLNATGLGIGTASPVSKLHVAGPGNTTGGNIHMGDNTDATTKAYVDNLSAPVGAIVAYNPGYYTASNNTGFTFVGVGANTVAAVNSYLPSNWRVCDGAALNPAAFSIP